MTFVRSELLQGARSGKLPVEFTDAELGSVLHAAWERQLAQLNLSGSDLDEAWQEWLQYSDSPPELREITDGWHQSLKAALPGEDRFLFVEGLGHRDHGRGDAEWPATHSVYFDSSAGAFQVTTYAWTPNQQDSRDPCWPISLVQSLDDDLTPKGDRHSLSSRQWRDMQEASGPNALSFSDYLKSIFVHMWGHGGNFPVEAGEPFGSRASVDQAALDLLEIQGRALVDCAIVVGTGHINSRADEVNELLNVYRCELAENLGRLVALAQNRVRELR